MGTINCLSCGANNLLEDFKFCPYCGNRLIIPGKCPKCGFENNKIAKFCQECGHPLSESDKNPVGITPEVIEISPIPKHGITIEFGYSSSPNFDVALEEAKLFSSFKQFKEGKKATYRINFDSNEIKSTVELVNLIRGWKSSRIYIEGEKSIWENTYTFLWCLERRNSCYKPNLYCFGYENDFDLNLWGCIQARMPFREHGTWFEWGNWVNNNGDWKFDKDRIKHELQKELFKYRYCPYMNLLLAEDVLIALPEVVNPRKDKNWKFVENWGSDGLSSGLTMVVKRFGYEDKVVMKCVAPNGIGAIKEVISKMKYKLPKDIIK